MFTLHVHVNLTQPVNVNVSMPGTDARLTVIERILQRLLSNGERLMASVEQLQAGLESVRTVTDEIAEVAGRIISNEQHQLALIQELRDQVAAGTPVSQEQLDALTANAESRVAALSTVRDALIPIGVDASNPAPPMPPVELPPAEEPPPAEEV